MVEVTIFRPTNCNRKSLIHLSFNCTQINSGNRTYQKEQEILSSPRSNDFCEEVGERDQGQCMIIHMFWRLSDGSKILNKPSANLNMILSPPSGAPSSHSSIRWITNLMNYQRTTVDLNLLLVCRISSNWFCFADNIGCEVRTAKSSLRTPILSWHFQRSTTNLHVLKCICLCWKPLVSLSHGTVSASNWLWCLDATPSNWMYHTHTYFFYSTRTRRRTEVNCQL